MKAHSEEIRSEVLRLLRQVRSLKEISSRTGICAGTIEDWACEWRKDGSLKSYIRPGMEFTNKARLASNGYYSSIRKRYISMRRVDVLEKREFGFNNPVEIIRYYLDDNGNPRVCTYCGKKPADGKVWGLDRLDSTKGHIPGNLVPCCGFHPEGMQLACQASKSKYTLFGWMEMNMARALGRSVSEQEVNDRIQSIKELAFILSQTN